MTVSADILNDFVYIHAVETITLTPQNVAATAVTGVKALRRARNWRTMSVFGDLGIEPNSIPFILFVGSADNVSLAGTVPKNGDKITDAAGVHWTIRQTSGLTLGSRYTCLCQQQPTN